MREEIVWIGGWKENSLVDVLENVSFTVWFSYCNFKCPWCANSRLARGVEKRAATINTIVEAVLPAAPFIDYFHVTGGEPTLQYRALASLLLEVKKRTGVKLSFDTNASIPEAIRYIMGKVDVDHIAIDVKAPLNNPHLYSKVTGVSEKYALLAVDKIKRGIAESAGVHDFLELRTLLVPNLLTVEHIEEIAREILDMSLQKTPRLVYVVQQFIPYSGVPEAYRNQPKTPRSQVVEAAKRAKEVLEGYAEVYYRTLEDGSRKIA